MPIPVITSPNTANATLGTLFSYQIAASNAPTSYGAKLLPPALSLNSSTGLIEGYVQGTGVYSVRLTSANNSGTSQEFALSLTVTGDTTDPIPNDAAGLMARPTSNIYANYGTGVGGSSGNSQVFAQQADVSVGTASTQLAPAVAAGAPAHRVTLEHPGGSNIVFLAIGKAASLNSGHPLYPGGTYTTDPIVGAVNGIVASGTETVTPIY